MSIDLAQVFLNLQDAVEAQESVSSQILDAIKERQADTILDFNEMVSDAYRANGWSSQAGRPAEGSTEEKAPATVKNYVATLRRAYNSGLAVMNFDTMGQLRKAVRDLRDASRESSGGKTPELVGVSLSYLGKWNGNPYHDIIRLSQLLPEEQRETLNERVAKLFQQFVKKAPVELALVA